MGTIYDLGRDLFGFGLDGDDLNVLQMSLRAVLVYAATIVMIRLGKRRFMSRASGMDMVVAVTIGAVVSRGIVGSSPFLPTLAAAAALVAMHWLISLTTYHFSGFEGAVKGDAVVLVESGKVDQLRLRWAHMSMEDLWEELRGQGVGSLEQVEKATLERNGRLSVLKHPIRMSVPEMSAPEAAGGENERTPTLEIRA